jgi:hypothetical protein
VRSGRLVALLVALWGCGRDHGAPCASGGEALRAIVPGASPAMRWQPLVVGATWTYRVSDGTTETVTVEAADTFAGAEPGALGYRVVRRMAYGAQLVSWWEDRGDQIVRHRELAIDGQGATYGDESFVPGRLVVDESPKHLVAAATWKQKFSDVILDSGETYSDCKTDHFEVQALDEKVTVPAGTFSCVRVRRTDTGATTWFARGVGQVKHAASTTSELASFQIP